jgi:hypothetical protein
MAYDPYCEDCNHHVDQHVLDHFRFLTKEHMDPRQRFYFQWSFDCSGRSIFPPFKKCQCSSFKIRERETHGKT